MNAPPYAPGTWPAVGVPVESRADVDRVLHTAAGAAARHGFSTGDAHRVERIVSDMATYLVTHQGAGRLLVRSIDGDQRHGMELVLSTSYAGSSVEADLHGALLSSDHFDVYAAPGRGSVMMAQLWNGAPPPGLGDRRFLVGSMSDPIAGESVSGDAWAVEQRGGRVVALVADGLGHGEEAASASNAAVCALRAHHLEPVEVIAACVHDALRRTRGAAIGLAEIDGDTRELRFCGIGNITARLLIDGGGHELLSRYGIAGYQSPRLRTATRHWPDDAMLVMHSDGLSSRWDAGDYPDLRRQHPQLAAATLMRDATRAHDDALVVAVRGSNEADHDPRRSGML